MMQTSNRWKHFAAMILIGDGVMAMIRPERDAHAWNAGPRPWRKLMRELRRHPEVTRAIGAAQIAGGIYWALCQERDD
jgi:hypothetical protein